MFLFNRAEYIWPEEWTILKGLVEAEKEINVYRVEEDNGIVTFITNPGRLFSTVYI